MSGDPEITKLREEAEKDYKDMRKFQAKFIEADQRLRAAEAEADKLREAPLCADHAQTWFCSRDSMKTESGCILCDAAAEVARLREALIMYGDHHSACDLALSNAGMEVKMPVICSCGFRQALAAKPKERSDG